MRLVLLLALGLALVVDAVLEKRMVPALCRETCGNADIPKQFSIMCKNCCVKCCMTGGRCMRFVIFMSEEMGLKQECLYDSDPEGKDLSGITGSGVTVECKTE